MYDTVARDQLMGTPDVDYRLFTVAFRRTAFMLFNRYCLAPRFRAFPNSPANMFTGHRITSFLFKNAFEVNVMSDVPIKSGAGGRIQTGSVMVGSIVVYH